VTLTSWSLRYLARYEVESDDRVEAAGEAGRAIEVALSNLPIPLHVVRPRAKSIDSMRVKLRSRPPRGKLYDAVGVRVITYYADHVDVVVDRLKSQLTVDVARSSDRRMRLEPREFGYRSVHLIVQLTDRSLGVRPYELLRDQWFEIQVRSILEHAWAEIDHQLRYKSRVAFDKDSTRDFAAIAGSLEILEKEFSQLRTAEGTLIQGHATEYNAGRGWKERLDTARMLAVLRVVRPDGLRWPVGRLESGIHLDASCLTALAAAECTNGAELRRTLLGARFGRAVAAYARLKSVPQEEVSDLAALVFAIGVRDRDVLAPSYPELLLDPDVVSVLVAVRGLRTA
jgi:ppGpp synthetase/RelA/SpoT-type nucleotidyltranferase